jgi:competence protein CoiA
MFARNMQLYAFNLDRELVFSRHANKKCNYICMECGGVLRLREGEKRQLHFYHLAGSPSCRQNSKSAAHLQVQLYLQRILPQGEVMLEYRFPEVNRIADAAWLPQKLIFEVQCSPLAKEEMAARVEDYSKCGFRVIWILHDKRYNQWRISSVERALKLGALPYYFTNIDEKGKGFIYDQWEHIQRGIRKSVLPALFVDIASPYPGGFKGDLGSLEEGHPYLVKAKERELALEVKKTGFDLKGLFQKVKEAGNKLLTHLLKPYCSD